MQIQAAVFHYKPDASRCTWELGLSTAAQRAAAYKYGHKGLILLDGTFNVSDKRLLLFILMVIDESWKGKLWLFEPFAWHCCFHVVANACGENLVLLSMYTRSVANFKLTQLYTFSQGYRLRTSSSQRRRGQRMPVPTTAATYSRDFWRSFVTQFFHLQGKKETFSLPR